MDGRVEEFLVWRHNVRAYDLAFVYMVLVI